jgi:polysaccharide deacetylase family protein (PEP-CTERM system associated)
MIRTPAVKPSHSTAGAADSGALEPTIILSFDVESHDQIEAAAPLRIDPQLAASCETRVAPLTRYLLEQLDKQGKKATFFIVGRIARTDPALIRDIHRAGHEVASHGWDHQRVHRLSPASLLEDLRRSKDALEQLIGEPVVGYRAPTFSVVRQTSWAIDTLWEAGIRYDSSIYPVRHDRYGVPEAPLAPFVAAGREHNIIEIPPMTWRLLGMTLPLGGGGYFRLFPLCFMRRALRQSLRDRRPPVAMIYFHPWEFDPDQPRLPLPPLNKFRTYVGIQKTRDRLTAILTRHTFSRAADVAKRLEDIQSSLRRFEFFSRP